MTASLAATPAEALLSTFSAEAWRVLGAFAVFGEVVGEFAVETNDSEGDTIGVTIEELFRRAEGSAVPADTSVADTSVADTSAAR